jgi:hypothetical protein
VIIFGAYPAIFHVLGISGPNHRSTQRLSPFIFKTPVMKNAMRTILLLLAFVAQITGPRAQVISHEYNLRLYPDQDAHYYLSNPGRGARSALKFDISRIPRDAEIKYVHLNAFVLYSEVAWDGDVDFFNLNHQDWLEAHEADTVELATRSDSIRQDTGFGMFQLGWHRSVDLRNILLRDYVAKNAYCTVFMVDPDDGNSQFQPGSPLMDHDTLICGELLDSGRTVFYASESPDTTMRPYLGIRYCFHTDTQLILTACDSIHLNGEIFITSGQYQQVIPNASGCDSTIHIDLTILHSSSDTLYLEGCDSVKVNGEIYRNSGRQVQRFINAVGCDSLLVLELTVHPSHYRIVDLAGCDSVEAGGKTFFLSGTYYLLLHSQFGCDSTVELRVTIHKASYGTLSRTGCDSLQVNGEWFTASGVYTQVLTNHHGCDSLLTLFLTVKQSTTGLLYVELCDSIVANGVWYYRSGTYFQKLTNAAGCDSLLTLNLTVLKSTSGLLSLDACDSVTINRQRFYSSGTYHQVLTNVAGCDSFLTIELRILYSTRATLVDTACDSLVVNGQAYFRSGNYVQVLQNSVGCDSVLSLELAILNSTADSLVLTLCEPTEINGELIDSSGTWVQVLQNVAGCDSVLVLEVLLVEIDTSVRYEGGALRAEDTFASYQWLDCDQGFVPLPGDTNSVFTPVRTGYYAVALQKDGCTDTSACYFAMVVATEDALGTGSLKVFPNPSNGQLQLEIAGAEGAMILSLHASGGREVFRRQLVGGRTTLTLDSLPPGLYRVVVTGPRGVRSKSWLRL